MEVRLDFEGSVYGFSKDQDGNGFWFCVSGKIPGMLGSMSSGIVVPRVFASRLSAEAIRRNLIDLSDIQKDVKRDEPKRKIVKIKKEGWKGAFNPFQGGKKDG